MLKNEFLNLTGLTDISDEKYDIIEAIYNYSSLKKEEFCDQFMIQGQNFTFEMVEEYIKCTTIEFNQYIDSFKRSVEDFAEFISIVSKNISLLKDSEDFDTILRMSNLSRSDQVRLKIKNKIELTDEDLKYISDNI